MIALPSARDLVYSLRELPSPPAIQLRLSELVSGADWSIREVAEVISADPGIAARLLRLANSPFYGVPRTVSSIHEAIILLGAGEIRSLVLATTVLERFDKVPANVVSAETLRSRAVHCGLAAARLGELAAPPGRGSEWFLMGLLFDVGSLAVCTLLPEAVREAVLMGTAPDESGGPSVECAVIGSQQAIVAAELLAHWRLPAVVAEAIQWSRVPLSAPGSRREAAILHIATRLSAPLARGEEPLPSGMAIDDGIWAAAGLTGVALDALPGRVIRDYEELSAWLRASD